MRRIKVKSGVSLGVLLKSKFLPNWKCSIDRANGDIMSVTGSCEIPRDPLSIKQKADLSAESEQQFNIGFDGTG
jgi:hypothetical protein